MVREIEVPFGENDAFLAIPKCLEIWKKSQNIFVQKIDFDEKGKLVKMGFFLLEKKRNLENETFFYYNFKHCGPFLFFDLTTH